MNEAALPTPRVRVLHEDARAYDFSNGATGQIESVSGRLDWVLDIPRSGRFPLGTVCGTSSRGDTAFLRMWCPAASLSTPSPVDLWDAELKVLADESEVTPVTNTAKVYRRLLMLRTGFAWSVRVGKHSARNTIRIMSSMPRQVDGKMTAHDAAMLAGIVGADFVNPRGGLAVSGDKGERRAMVYLLAGAPQPCAPVLRLAR